MKHFSEQLIALTLCAVVLAGVFVPASFAPGHAPRADAQIDAIGGAAGCALSGFISNQLGGLLSSFGLEVPVGEGQNRLKEQLLDCAAWVVNNILIEEITTSVINWINSGFDGNPAFVEDVGRFLGDVADQAAGEFIHSSDFGFLCSPFQLDIQLSLLQQQRGFAQQVSCTLSDVTDNIDNFIDGSFGDGGWQAWFQLTTKPQNNPYGAFLLAQDERDRRVAAAVNNRRDELEQNDGFLSFRRCANEPDVGGALNDDGILENIEDIEIKPSDTDCEIVTPGSVIESQLNQTLQIGNNRITVADELNEILSALINQLVTSIFSDDGGLRNFDSTSFVDDGGGFDFDIPDFPGGPAEELSEPIVFEQPGTVHVPTPQNPVAQFDIPMTADDRFERVTIDLDVTPGPLNPENPEGLHNIFWLQRGTLGSQTWRGDILGYVNLLDRTRARVTHSLDTEVITAETGGVWGFTQGVQSHVQYIYDTSSRQITLTVTNPGEAPRIVYSSNNTASIISAEAHTTERQIPPGFFIWLGVRGNDTGPEVQTLGWKYSNLRIEFGDSAGGFDPPFDKPIDF